MGQRTKSGPIWWHLRNIDRFASTAFEWNPWISPQKHSAQHLFSEIEDLFINIGLIYRKSREYRQWSKSHPVSVIGYKPIKTRTYAEKWAKIAEKPQLDNGQEKTPAELHSEGSCDLGE